MRKENYRCKHEILENITNDPKILKEVAKYLCDKALREAKAQLHPLLRQVTLESLDQRCEFLLAFKGALEKEIARKIVVWQPCVQAVYKFDDLRGTNTECWDNTIHLLVLVPEFLNQMEDLGAKLDHVMLEQLRQLDWTRFQKSRFIIEIQQVTSEELRHGVSYGAMFLSLYAAPVKVWPLSNR